MNIYKDHILAERKLQTVIGENARRKPRDVYDAGWLVHERPELISRESATKLNRWIKTLEPAEKQGLVSRMQRDRVIRRCDVLKAFTLLEEGIDRFDNERDGGVDPPADANRPKKLTLPPPQSRPRKQTPDR